jgi:hypothetical protein
VMPAIRLGVPGARSWICPTDGGCRSVDRPACYDAGERTLCAGGVNRSRRSRSAGGGVLSR